ncbi:MAG TPA: SIS domain-containing protein [Thermoleophilaceae bacterium]
MSGVLMRSEMAEQPAVLARFANRFDDHVSRVRALLPERLAGVTFVARGSSDHAAVYGRYLAELASGRPAALAAPSLQTLYGADVDYESWLVVALSQSGATPEIGTVMRRLQSAGARTVAIVNDEASPLAEAAELVIGLDAGEERAVPATKTVTSELLAVGAVAAALGPLPFDRAELDALPGAVTDVLAWPEPAAALAERWLRAERTFVTARGLLLAAALETALKIKETTGVLAEGLSAADLRHGPIAATGPGAPVLAIDAGGPASADMREIVDLAGERGADVARCAPGEADLPLPGRTPEALTVVTATIRGQQLALAMSEARGFDPDAPAGLSKVTATK